MNGKLRAVQRVFAALIAGSFFAVTAYNITACKPKEKKALAADCASDDECESANCSDVGNVCSKTCTYDKDCGGEMVCRALSETQNECDKNVGQAVGGSCMMGGDCANGLCLHYVGKETQPGICSKYCSTEADCSANYKICDKISDSGLLKVCLPGDPKAAASGSASQKFAKPEHQGKKKGGKKKGEGGGGKKKKKG